MGEEREGLLMTVDPSGNVLLPAMLQSRQFAVSRNALTHLHCMPSSCSMLSLKDLL